MRSQQRGSRETHCDTLKPPFQPGLQCQSRQERSISHSEYRIFGPQNKFCFCHKIEWRNFINKSLFFTAGALSCLHMTGLMASVISVGPQGLLRMRDFQRWVSSLFLDAGGGFPGMSSGSPSLERPRNLHHGGPLGSFSYEENCDNGCFVDRLGSCVPGECREWHLAPEAPSCSYKLPGVVGFPDSETFFATPEELSCVGQNRQYDSCGIHKQTRGHLLHNITQTGPQTVIMEQ